MARAWGLRQFGIALAAVIAFSVAWRGPVSVPGRRDVAELIWPLVPCLFALVVPTVAARAHTDQERCAPRRGWGRRLAFVTGLCGATVALATLLAIVHPFLVVARNTALLCGMSLAATVLLPASTRWIPVSFFPILSWLLGAPSPGNPPAGWAVLLHDASSGTAAWAAAACITIGAGLYVAIDRPRTAA